MAKPLLSTAKQIDLANRGRMASRLMDDLRKPLEEMEEEIKNAIVMAFRNGATPHEHLGHAANLSSVRWLRERLEMQVRVGRKAGEELMRNSQKVE